MIADHSAEEWRSVAGFSGYEVSSFGRVRSWRPINGRPETITIDPRILAQTKSAAGGHRIVTLCNGRRTGNAQRLVHRLVLESFVGPCPEGMECCHSNGDPSDNRLENLRWDSRRANAADRDAHGRTYRGDVHWNVRINSDIARRVIGMLMSGITQVAICKELGLAKHIVCDIKRKRTWSTLWPSDGK